MRAPSSGSWTMPSGQLSSRSQRRFPIKPRFSAPVRSSTVATSPKLRDLTDYAFAMAALIVIPYQPPVSRSKNPSTEGFRPIGDFTKPVKSASQPTSRLVSQQRDGTARKKYDRDSPAVFTDPYRDLPEDTVEWLLKKPLSDCTYYGEGKDDSSSKVQNRGDCQGERELSTL